MGKRKGRAEETDGSKAGVKKTDEGGGRVEKSRKWSGGSGKKCMGETSGEL